MRIELLTLNMWRYLCEHANALTVLREVMPMIRQNLADVCLSF